MSALQISIGKLKDLSSAQKIVLVVLADLALLYVAVLLAYVLRLSSFGLPPPDTRFAYLIVPILSVVVAYIFGVYAAAARNYSQTIERKLAASQFVATIVWMVLLLSIGTVGFPRSIFVIYPILALFGMILLRRFASLAFNFKGKAAVARRQESVIVYGAGREGMALADSLRRDGRYKPVAFLDTDYSLVDRMVSGLRVFSVEDIGAIVKRFTPRDVIIAKPGMNRANRRVLVEMLINHGLAVKTAPGLEEIIGGNVRVGDIRPIRVEDLLGRDPVPPHSALMDKATRGRCVVVTGAGGSIGSELARQVAGRSPLKLVLIDNNEFALFEIHREIENQMRLGGLSEFSLIPILADVKDKPLINSVMADHGVDVVFHAAAYKHVRMVQDNVVAGITNNITGTQVVAEAAMAHGVDRFILISTDKAVRPTSVMGASKRVAEMVVQALAAEPSHKTIFSMVRFGNVLGSTGSVVPLFREQIASGGPVTVTHPDVTRFFMLIPEAAQLVIQAGAMAEGGDVFVLDMGEPIKIMQLAETMIELAGLTCKTPEHPEGDIDIRFIGLKDGEKLHEELEIGNDLSPTHHNRILRAREFFLPAKALKQELDQLLGTKSLAVHGTQTQRLLALAMLQNEQSDKASSPTLKRLRKVDHDT